jgi:hypothetical protein
VNVSLGHSPGERAVNVSLGHCPGERTVNSSLGHPPGERPVNVSFGHPRPRAESCGFDSRPRCPAKNVGHAQLTKEGTKGWLPLCPNPTRRSRRGSVRSVLKLRKVQRSPRLSFGLRLCGAGLNVLSEYSHFPLNVLFVSYRNAGGRLQSGAALYEPDFRMYRKQGHVSSMRYDVGKVLSVKIGAQAGMPGRDPKRT